MVTKQEEKNMTKQQSLSLTKIHMVTKRSIT